MHPAELLFTLNRVEAGVRVQELSRQHNVAEPSICCWKAKYGSMDVSKAKGAGTEEQLLGEVVGGCVVGRCKADHI